MVKCPLSMVKLIRSLGEGVVLYDHTCPGSKADGVTHPDARASAVSVPRNRMLKFQEMLDFQAALTRGLVTFFASFLPLQLRVEQVLTSIAHKTYCEICHLNTKV